MATRIKDPIGGGLNLKCMVKPMPNWSSANMIEGIVLQFVPSNNIYCHKIAGKQPQDLHSINMDALVVLQTFDKGAVYQIPLTHLEIVNEWWENE
jgi:hypothetical protein